jgi:crotonobetainyl-CoA:carnitine CoA-transferase CaiB-like acyl-CoA transferase
VVIVTPNRPAFGEASVGQESLTNLGYRRHEGHRIKLADMARRIDVTQAWVDLAAWQSIQGKFRAADYSLLKVQATQTLEFAAREAAHILGGGFVDAWLQDRAYLSRNAGHVDRRRFRIHHSRYGRTAAIHAMSRVQTDGISGLKVVDSGRGMAPALLARLLAQTGAHVVRAQPTEGDPFEAIYPALHQWRNGIHRIDWDQRDAVLSASDLCLVGGEDFPGLESGPRAEEFAQIHPHLIIVDISAYSPGLAEGAAVDLLVQARTGLLYEHSTRRAINFGFRAPTYGAVLASWVGLWAALIDRQRSGRGQVVSTSLQEGISLFWSPLWLSAERADAEFSKISPKDARHLLFECSDGLYVNFVMGIPGAVSKLYSVLGIDAPVDPNDRGLPRATQDPTRFFGDLNLIAPYVRKWKRAELLNALWATGIAAEPVLNPGECWDDPQVKAVSAISCDENGWRSAAAPFRLHTTQRLAAPSVNSERHVESDRPLEGLRVIDLGAYVAGPFTSKMLADLGADVVKIEPLGGSPGRGMYPTILAVDRGKRRICIDAKSKEGLRLIQRLCASADIVHHNFRPGVAQRLGLNPESLRQHNPRLIVLETSGYGQHGPKAERLGLDMAMQAFCGHEARAGGQGNTPFWCRSSFIDYATGALGAGAVLASVFERNATGAVLGAEVSLLSTALFLMSEIVQSPTGDWIGDVMLDHDQTGFHPAERIYQTADGWIAVAARSNRMAAAFARAVAPNLTVGPRTTWDVATAKLLADVIRQRKTFDMMATLSNAHVWAEVCDDDAWTAIRDDPAAREAGLVVELQDERYGAVLGSLGPLVRLSASKAPSTPLRSVVAAGRDTHDLLTQSGYSQEDISRFLRERIVA